MKLQFLLPTVYIHILCNQLSKVFVSAAKRPMELSLILSNCIVELTFAEAYKNSVSMHPSHRTNKSKKPKKAVSFKGTTHKSKFKYLGQK
jgi:hypothetical protein